jgi:acylphosphatase
MAYSCDFEVEGRVQGVFFRACTEKKAKELGLVGWVMNTPQGTVKGVCQSKDKNSLDQMKVGVKKKIIVSFLVLWF